jgi:flagellar protein FliS
MNAYVNQYKNNQVLNASPEQILIMLYDGALRFLRQAKAAIEAGDTAEKTRAISKTVAIIAEFSNTLDRENGGEIAEDLSRLYDFSLRELSMASLKNDAARLEPVEKILQDLREGFAEAAIINRKAAHKPQFATSPEGDEDTPRFSASF